MDIGNLATEFGNMAVVLSSVFGMFYALTWHKSGLTNGSATLIKAWVCIITAVALRGAWWVLALKLAVGNQTYHPSFVEWKWAVAVPSALLFTYGVILFIDSINSLASSSKYFSFVACMLVASILVMV